MEIEDENLNEPLSISGVIKISDPLKDIYKAYNDPLQSISSFNRATELFASNVNLLGPSLTTDYLTGTMAKITSAFDKINKFASPIHSLGITSAIIEPLMTSSLSIAKLTESDTLIGLSKSFEIGKSWLSDYESKNLLISNNYDELVKGSLASPLLAGTTYNLNSGINRLHELVTVDNGLINQFSLQASLGKVTELNLFAEKSLTSISALGNIGVAIGMSNDFQTTLSTSLNLVTDSYKDIFKGFEVTPATILELNPTLLRGIPTQLFNTSNLLESISITEIEDIEEEEIKTDIIYENEIGLSYYLNKLDKDLYKMWIGAKDALQSKNPDRIRHFSISLRELMTHVLHSLAPTDQVKGWTKDPLHYHEGKPTRKARILYICREIRTSNFDKYVNADVNSMIEFINLFQEGSHAKSPSFTDKQLIAMRTKAESTLKFLLEIAEK
jgi:Predicted pPIWI-associating nuclease